MSDLSYKLAELRPAMRPAAESTAWVASFVIANAISQQPIFFLILLLVVGADLLDTSDKTRGLSRDFIAGAVTTILSIAMNDPFGLSVGALVTLASIARLLQKIG